ncbi:hypothetical protein BO71DRAFT_33142 [Aspergillus ellipticus CBS 707.79]|uniref:Uncharacterized protein n=1 Tax=Aspergillus ellipticus CBS 707.79 TaxID=1448320 RepID=A0A319DMQ9_9EURO|nr:hypothetical protein BO71DRAFT_33142 [Aspergillus ellipticus CBS 707.79]
MVVVMVMVGFAGLDFLAVSSSLSIVAPTTGRHGARQAETSLGLAGAARARVLFVYHLLSLGGSGFLRYS